LVQFVYQIKNENGIHARPAAALVKEAKSMTSQIEISVGEKRADMKKMFALMALGVRQHDTATVTLTGPDEEAEALLLEKYMRAHF